MNPLVIDLAKRLLGQNLQLHLQNGIINPPDNYHHQAAWHRDLPYQDWVISKPLAINAFYCLTDFTNTNGATFVLPYSHRSDFFPSEKFVIENELQIIAPKGSVIFFDSMLFHRAGYNTSSDVRIGVNNMFVSPIIKQQINIPQAILEKYHIDELSDEEQLILGFKFQLANNVVEYRKRRTNKS
ncbi:MAG: phytanoyl-CoA dioxygenase family protein [Cyclobacteriaceae bacterium]|nr:phytanoyl-CoA dioxygenase family protein [Cyclobacteriaceae bacterium]